MNSLHDLTLDKPLPELWWRGLLFFTFFLHFVFVLLVIGTATMAVAWFVRGRWGGDERVRGQDRELMSYFFVHKALAVVLGIAPILLMQIGNTVPFMTAGILLAPLWLGITVWLLLAFGLLEWFAERGDRRPWLYLSVAAAGLASLLAVPATFVAVVVTAENPGQWGAMFERGGRLPAPLALHWLARLGHVLGAAMVVSTAFYAFVFARDPERRRSLTDAMVASLLFQIVEGVALYASLPRSPQPLIVLMILAGVSGACLLVWSSFRVPDPVGRYRPGPLFVLVLGILTPMLLTRQALQDRALVPLNRQVAANAAEHARQLRPHREAALSAFQEQVRGTRNGAPSLYARSCAFCHGPGGEGRGPEAQDLTVPPEDLTAMRMGRTELLRILRDGVPGTGMPTFRFYTEDQLQSLAEFLERRIGLARRPEPIPTQVAPAAVQRAEAVFASECAICHGPDGRGSDLARKFDTPPPVLSRLGLSPRRSFDVITDGYPGTLMPSFRALPEETRWGLVRMVQGFFRED